MPRCCINSGVCLSGEVRHFEITRYCSFFQDKYLRIVNFVAKDLDERLVISDNNEVITAMCEVA